MKDEIRRARVSRPARPDGLPVAGSVAFPVSDPGQRTICRKVLIVDLNNFSTFPTYAIGLLVAALRGAGHEVRVLSPLAHDVPAVERERREHIGDHLKRRLHLSTLPAVRGARDMGRWLRDWRAERPHPVVLREVARAMADGPDVVLLSAYLQHFNTVRDIGLIAQQRQVPVLLGGPMFSLGDTAEAWRGLPGLAAVVGAEADRMIVPLVEALCDGRTLLGFPGVTLPDGTRSARALPLRQLDEAPMADFADFPWDRYPVRIVPMMTGRGCQWDKCLFCSDVISVSGRTFRTRSVGNVLLEMQEQARRHGTTNFLFLDLKLNSLPDMIRGIAEQAQSYVQGAEWIGTVHVDQRKDNGLSATDLRAAAAGGMRRISFGLETGSQRLLDLMNKGSSVEGNVAFIRNAHAAGLSVRCTMFKGFPGETADDMQATARFLAEHAPYLDRVRFNDFSLMQDTPIYKEMLAHTDGPMEVRKVLDRRAKALYLSGAGHDRAYRRAKADVLQTVYEINRRPIRPSARQFDGLM